MSLATMTSKGQTTIPLSVRLAAGIHPGDKIYFTVLDDGTIIGRVKNKSIRDLAVKPRAKQRVTVDKMNR